ncbi:GroES-like protein [Apiospora kogelbergensis]|uniref:GroES-like protein n=1 Tax=Apiospora kogelbergensis TaxID=1337665 RepID=A0AAW0R6W9_9PEZI
MSPIPPLPSHHRALTLKSTEVGLELTTVPTPVPSHGTVLVHVEAASVLSYHREIFNGARKYPLPSSTKDGAGFAGGYSAVGRVASVGPDATLLKPGQLVFADCVIHARDDPAGVFYLVGVATGSTDGGRYLANHVWRDGAFAEYVALPLENCVPLDESRLCSAPSAGGLGYSVADLAYASYLLVAYGGLRDIGLEPGETLIVCPATGGFGGAGVMTAVAMGARVIAMGRNATELARLQDRVATTYTAGNSHVETAAGSSTHLRSAIRALRRGGRVSLMGMTDDFADRSVVANNLTLKGKVMYEREDMVLFFKLLEAGLFPRGGGLDGGNENNFAHTKAFGLHQSQEALDAAAEHTGIGRSVVFAPEGMD